MIKIAIGALGMYIYLQHPEQVHAGIEATKVTLVSALDWVSAQLKS
jgi:hypothetical protein